MSIAHVTGDELPAPAGPYSCATVASGLVFVAGQAGHEANGRLAADIEGQTRQALRNVQMILEAAGSRLSDVLHCRVYLSDIRNFERMNTIYGEVFQSPYPARTTVEVSALPAPGLLIEIDVVAFQSQ